jgi:DNA-binding NarL/FixJ family response regulator
MQKILIVDDNALFRETLKESLNRQFASLLIFEAKNGKDALSAPPTLHPDLIVMDIHLPHGNGLELTRRIKSLFPEIVIFVLTGYDFPEYRDAALENKADHYAPKDLFMPLLTKIISVETASE